MIALNTVVYNEAHNIIACLTSAARFCDEFIVVDQNSTDGTADLARNWGATVYTDHHWGYCEPSREYAAFRTESPWVLALDGDERYVGTYALLDQIAKTHNAARFSVASYVDGIRTDPLVNGTPHANYQLRFFKRGTVTFDPKLHGRIIPNYDHPDRVARIGGGAQIVNLKTSADLELARTRDQVYA